MECSTVTCGFYMTEMAFRTIPTFSPMCSALYIDYRLLKNKVILQSSNLFRLKICVQCILKCTENIELVKNKLINEWSEDRQGVHWICC